ncbi:enterobactin synthase subunit EntD [Enterobacter quasiroggenkampii]|uniref:enterobactin synthase subunit EntD n=1 Tax=Enterobacter quasiroggenkampii TaxID=2497436 RepID=UPI0021D28654|nr:enterobactin synthase subunit EntD [Enterobacter quasiroggenkampii]MCU6386102.1 enterobactin synthase subunit EntD [Enterobacter quasiroggenkampii]MCU6395189.1 enterobactin synthase subunit EntD [Enterobacter quasiroggenkampii]MCU6404282.1 enterobactin synthase subunit EntD [Enterobacter quasiroggenkampii]MCU6417856.1 enterobactin synthase subunit EntD [Enterobacter quasiroggenkampii]
MHTTHTTFILAGHTVHHVTFDPTTFTDADLLWLPHHAELSNAGRKRKAEHLAGRIAAAHALPDHTVPGIGPSGEPLWPEDVSGSITHCGMQAMAVAVRHPDALVGIDCEAILPDREAREIKAGVIDAEEESVLIQSGYPFHLALTLAFSAKESLFKALFPYVKTFMGFDTARVKSIEESRLTLALTGQTGGFNKDKHYTLAWQSRGERVCTLIVE